MVRHNQASYLISGPYLFDHLSSFIGFRVVERLRKAWGALTVSLLEPAVGTKKQDVPYLITNKDHTWGVRNDFYGYHDDEYFLVAPPIRDNLNELDWAMRLALEYGYLMGRQQGLNILAKLSEGEVTLSDYNNQLEIVKNRLKQIGGQVKETD